MKSMTYRTLKQVILSILFVQVLYSQEVMNLGEITTGMKGYGKTVFLGSKVERFDFEVLGIQKNSTPGRSIILVRVLSPALKESGIFQGMSGSPCFINGKIIGALSSGFAFSKDSIGGITPMQYMLDQLLDFSDSSLSKTPLILPKINPPQVLKSALQGKMIPFSEFINDADTPKEPLAISGSILASSAKSFWPNGLIYFSDTSVTLQDSTSSEEPSLEPGATAVISLVSGDLDLSASGTITYIKGNRILMFGHPLLNLGLMDAPLLSGKVISVIPSLNSSFKLTAPSKIIGAIKLDRSSGVSGLLGSEAKTIPIRLGMNLGGKRSVNLSFQVIDHPVLTPYLVATVLTQALESNVRGLGLQSLSLQGNIKLAGYPPIDIENFVADLNGSRMAEYVGGIIQSINFNPFERPRFEGISLNIKAEERLDATAVVSARILTSRVKRGDSIPVALELQNIQGIRENVIFNLAVPLSAQKGKSFLLVGDGLSLMAADPDEASVELGSLGDVVRILNASLRNNHAYGLLVQSAKGTGLRGIRLEGIPPSVASLIGADTSSLDARLQRRIISRAVIPLDREVRGLASIEIEVE